jgi:alcohol dehydrogenase class IV
MAHVELNLEIPDNLKKGFIFRTPGVVPPNGVYFGFNAVKQVGELAVNLNAQKVILITDKTMVEIGCAAEIRKLLEAQDLEVDLFGEVEPEPHIETLNRIYEMIKKKKYDLVVGLGGGSIMDMSKASATLATNLQDPADLLKKKVIKNPSLKTILIPTTAGTGSEVSCIYLVKMGEEKCTITSPYVFARIAIVDPALTISMPPKVTASTGIDALSHAIECVMNKATNLFYDSIAYGSIDLISKHLLRATDNGNDLEARYYMSMGAMMAMVAFNGTGGGLYAHSLANVLGMFRPTPHGVGCGISLPHTMAFNRRAVEEKLVRVAHAVGEKTDTLLMAKAATQGIERVFKLLKEVKLPVSLKEMGFRYDDLDRMTEICIDTFPRPNNPRIMTKEDVRKMLDAIWEGKVNYNL